MHDARILIVSFLLNSVWQIALIAAAGWLAAHLLRRIGPQAEHAGWVFTLIAAILAPLLSIFPWGFAALFPPDLSGLHGSIIMKVSGNVPHNLRGTWQLAGLFVSPVIALYFASLAYFAFRLLGAGFVAAGLLREASPTSLTPEQEKHRAQCQQRFQSPEARILSSGKISGPVVLGLRRPVLLLPAGFAERCESQDFLAALAHECAHIRRRDFKKNLFYEFASLIVAFHPAIWFIKSQIAQTREMACDAMATEMLGEPRSYVHSLMRLAVMVAAAPRIASSPAIGIFDANILEKRIMRMKIKKQHFNRAWKYGLILPAALFLFSIVSAGMSLALEVEQQPLPSAATKQAPYGPLYRIGGDVTAPYVVHSVEAEFPPSARNSKEPISGIVIVGIVVDAAGVPHDAHIVRSYRPDFDAQAVKAIEQYRFKPAGKAGKPVAVTLSIEVDFKRL
jgi:TonB family protein